ncbi:hypothetical protein [Roseomonas sp. CECT 9278]|uniref:hypothetical protein n=1 Tax=Roseomonas sp. CECT 9278 TaxID=2845823 RepID=UPI001E5AD103|nr:hypothetical protein [Roseomonas sp. CECT 9278]CAH0298989.1 hypothetical protein ROS9278_04482 [Roseomonas sp. CECT 9278]
MRPVAISAVLLGLAQASFGAAAMPAAPALLAEAGQGVTLARAGALPGLAEAAPSGVLPVGDGDRGRWRRGPPHGHGWGPPPRAYYYAPPPPRYYRPPPPVYYAPPPRAYYAPPPRAYYAPPPPVYYAPQPGVSLNFRF